MSTINILRMAGGRSLARALGSPLLQNAPKVGALVPKQSLMLSPAMMGRIYGPEPTPSASMTSHWKQEKILSVALIGIIPVAIAIPHPALDYLLAGSVVLHAHWGLHGVINDYMHGPTLPRVGHAVLYVATILAFAGLCNLNYNDIGLANAIRMLYSKL